VNEFVDGSRISFVVLGVLVITTCLLSSLLPPRQVAPSSGR
jgi:hypothetical protein